MTVGETELEMATRHVAEQVERITRQKTLIERLRLIGLPLDDALELLGSMERLLAGMGEHVARLSH